jgi:hypothetical protein
MPVFKIMRIYEIPAESQTQATNRMMEALTLQVEKDFHVADYIKCPDDPQGKGKKVSLVPPSGWIDAFIEQLLGWSEKK